MAKIVGKPFPKGSSGNPGGRNKIDPEISKFKQMTYQDFIDKLQEFGALNTTQLKAVVENKETPVFQLIFARILFEAQKGNMKAMQMLLERLWGKPKDTDIDFDALKNAAPQVIINLPDNGRDMKKAE